MARLRFALQSTCVPPARSESTPPRLHIAQDPNAKLLDTRTFFVDQHQLPPSKLFAALAALHTGRKGLQGDLRCSTRKSSKGRQWFGYSN